MSVVYMTYSNAPNVKDTTICRMAQNLEGWGF